MLLTWEEWDLLLGYECLYTLPAAGTVTTEQSVDKGQENKWDTINQWWIWGIWSWQRHLWVVVIKAKYLKWV